MEAKDREEQGPQDARRRIVLLGATGYTGRLTARAMVNRGVRPVLAGRDPARLGEVAAALGADLESAVVDVEKPQTLLQAFTPGDVVVTTVGPFAKHGHGVVDAAIERGTDYIDSTGEPSFVRAIFERCGPPARARSVGLVTACGGDWVPGNLAGALAVESAGGRAARIVVGYFLTGSAARFSGGTIASAASTALEPSFTFRDGRLVTERGSRRVAAFEIDGKRRQATSIGASEHFSLPRLHPEIRDVDVYLGWFGRLSRLTSAGSTLMAAASRSAAARSVLEAGLGRAFRGSTGGPDAAERARSGMRTVAIALGRDDETIARVDLAGPNIYEFTAEMLAWAAAETAARGMDGTGALGPVEAFGLDRLTAGAREAGLVEVP